MTIRKRKFFGMIAMLQWLTVYALVVMALGGQYVVGNGMWLELPFYILGGLGWLPVAMTIIRWMSRPDPE